MSTFDADAVILAAGRGSRLRPITDHTPKPLVPVAGRPLIAWGLDLLRRHGARDVVVNVHHLRERVMEELGDGSGYGLDIRFSVEPELLDTGGGIRQAADLVRKAGGTRRPLVVLNADIVTDVDLGALLRTHHESGAGVTLVLRDAPDAARYGLFGIDDDGRVRRFLGRGAPADGLRELMFASVHVLSPEVIDRMPSGAFSSMHDVYPKLWKEGVPFVGYVHDGLWFVNDTAEDVARTEQALARPKAARS